MLRNEYVMLLFSTHYRRTWEAGTQAGRHAFTHCKEAKAHKIFKLTYFPITTKLKLYENSYVNAYNKWQEYQ